MAPPPVGQGSKEPARGGVLGVSSATSFFLEFPLALALALCTIFSFFGTRHSTRARARALGGGWRPRSAIGGVAHDRRDRDDRRDGAKQNPRKSNRKQHEGSCDRRGLGSLSISWHA